MNRSSVVLRTDNVVVEALLGQADALDPYESALQALDLIERDAGIQRATDALALVKAQPADKRVDAWGKVFPENPEIEVVPAAAVSNGDKH